MSDGSPTFRAFSDADGDLQQIAGRKIAFVGYGNQGRAQALNLRDSLRTASIDAPITISALHDETWQVAEQDGFEVREMKVAIGRADVIFLLVPDETLPDVWLEIERELQANDTMVFASGYNLTYGTIEPPSNVDVVLLAPRMIGRGVRLAYTRGGGFYSYIGVERDASGGAWTTLLALAKGVGALRGALEISAEQETFIDLYMEQGFGAIFGRLVFETLATAVEAGLPPEAMVLELYMSGEMAETMQAMADLGFVEQSRLHSPTSQYGGMTRSMRLDREPLRKHLQQALEEIKNGSFAKEWAAERTSGYKTFEQMRSLGAQHNPFTPIEERLRGLVGGNKP